MTKLIMKDNDNHDEKYIFYKKENIWMYAFLIYEVQIK